MVSADGCVYSLYGLRRWGKSHRLYRGEWEEKTSCCLGLLMWLELWGVELCCTGEGIRRCTGTPSFFFLVSLLSCFLEPLEFVWGWDWCENGWLRFESRCGALLSLSCDVGTPVLSGS